MLDPNVRQSGRRPHFSVIIPFRNALATLPEALASLLAQTDPDWEAILVDDASSDGGVDLIRKAAAEDKRFLLIANPGQPRCRGPAKSRNLGIAAAGGAYVAFLDADDRWLPEKLALQRRAFEQGADIVFSAYRRIDASGRPLSVVPARAQVKWADALAGNPIGCLTGAWRKSRFPLARMPDRDMHEDYAFWLMLLRDGAIARGLPQVLAEYRVQPESASSNKFAAARAVWDILGTQDLTVPQRSLNFLRYTLQAIRRRL